MNFQDENKVYRDSHVLLKISFSTYFINKILKKK